MMEAWFSSSEMIGRVLAEQGLEDAAVGVEGRGIEQGVVRAQELAHPPLELLVDLGRPADEAHRSHAVAQPEERVIGGGHDPRLVAEPQVVVGAEIEDLGPALGPDLDALGGRQDPLGLVEALGPDPVQLALEIFLETSVHCSLLAGTRRSIIGDFREKSKAGGRLGGFRIPDRGEDLLSRRGRMRGFGAGTCFSRRGRPGPGARPACSAPLRATG